MLMAPAPVLTTENQVIIMTEENDLLQRKQPMLLEPATNTGSKLKQP